MSIEYKLIRSNRKSIEIQIKEDGSVIVRAPKRATLKSIQSVVDSREDWINHHLEKMMEKRSNKPPIDYLSEEELKALAKEAKKVIPGRVLMYANLVGVDYGRIAIRTQRTRWGSCSSKGNLNFNCLLMLAPVEVLDSVIVHELCHRKEMNHSRRFYELVYKAYPEYDKWHGWLKKHGSELLRRVPDKK